MRRWTTSLACLGVVGMLAACSSGSKARSAAPTTDAATPATAAASAATPSTTAASTASGATACTLLSAAEVQTAAGASVASGTASGSADGKSSLCNWTVTDPSGSGFGTELSVFNGVSSADFDMVRQAAQGTTNTLAGLGDSAFSELTNRGGFVFDDVYVLKGSHYFRVEFLKDAGTGPLTMLARLVLTRLG